MCATLDNSESDDRLVEAARGGQELALSELLQRHGPAVRAGLSIDPKWASVLESDDVMQVTYMEAFLRIEQFRPQGPGAFVAWLRSVADNNLRDAIKGLERLKRPQPEQRVTPAARDESASGLMQLLGVTTTTPSRAVAARELSDVLDSALEVLPEDYAAVVRLYDLEALPIGNVAGRLQRSPGAVHMLRQRAHDQLRDLLGSSGRFFSHGA